jgi:hypothetical protein
VRVLGSTVGKPEPWLSGGGRVRGSVALLLRRAGAEMSRRVRAQGLTDCDDFDTL